MKRKILKQYEKGGRKERREEGRKEKGPFYILTVQRKTL